MRKERVRDMKSGRETGECVCERERENEGEREGYCLVLCVVSEREFES